MESLIFKEISEGRVDAISFLLDRGLSIDCAHGQQKNTALHLAVYAENEVMVKILITAGANANVVDKEGNTPLKVALCKENLKISKILIDAGADVNTRGPEGCTALHGASCDNETDLMRHLLCLGANVNARHDKGGTPLHTAACENQGDSHFKALKILLSNNADVNAQNPRGETPLHLLTALGCTNKCIELFSKYKADFNAKDKDGRTPLHVAMIFNHGLLQMVSKFSSSLKHKIQMIKGFIRNGANPNALDKDGQTPLTYVLFNQSLYTKYEEDEIKLLNFLLEHADVNLIEKNGRNIISASPFQLPEYAWKTLLQHVAKLKMLDIPVHKSLLHSIMNKRNYKIYFNKYSRELLDAKNIKIHNCSVTCFNLLTEDEMKLINYVGNEDFIKEFEKLNVAKKFPVYGASMERKVAKAMKNRKIWDNAAVILSNRLPVFSPANIVIKDILNCFTIKFLLKINKQKRKGKK